MKIGVLGPKGTFSDKAYIKFKKYKTNSADLLNIYKQ